GGVPTSPGTLQRQVGRRLHAEPRSDRRCTTEPAKCATAKKRRKISQRNKGRSWPNAAPCHLSGSEAMRTAGSAPPIRASAKSRLAARKVRGIAAVSVAPPPLLRRNRRPLPSLPPHKPRRRHRFSI